MEYSLRELECFTAVAEELSFTRAARRLHLSQPPLSRHIRALEEKIGARLFTREARTVALTQAGLLFHEESRGILAQLARAGEIARRSAHGESDRLRLGMVSAVLSVEIADILRRFREAHPSVQIVLHDLPPAEQLRLIGEGRLDGGFVGLLPVERRTNLRFDKWCRERLLAFVPSGHVFAGRREVSLAELRPEKFVAVSSEAAPAFSVLLHELCRKAGFRPSIVLESPRAQAVAVMVGAGCGVAVLPESLANFAGSSVVGIPLKGSPAITHIFASAGKTPSPAIKELLKLLGKSSR
jgi:DNA-binding transcriptional LysR family regulator